MCGNWQVCTALCVSKVSKGIVKIFAVAKYLQDLCHMSILGYITQ